jgi:hypothetical protein
MTVSRHDSRFAANAFPSLLMQFGEPLVFEPGEPHARNIVGIVNREPPEVYDAGGNPIYGDYVISVHNSSTLGVLDTELDRGNQVISVRSRASALAPVVRKTIVSKESEDNGVMVLRLR